MSEVVFDYEPLPVHIPFHTSTARERVMFGGYGSGKSYALCSEAIKLMLNAPGIQGCIIRKTVPSLRDTTEAIFVSLLPDAFLKECKTERGGGHYQAITFPNGSQVLFRSIPTPADWLKLKSLNLGFIAFDEVDELDQESFEGMTSRLRQTEPLKGAKALGAGPIDKRHIIAASNPAGHNWCFERWINTAGEHYYEKSEAFISTTLDNPTLPGDYIDSLLAMPEPWIRRYVLSSFDEFGGAIYPEWEWETHVIEPFKDSVGRYKYDPANWFIMGFDPGTSSGNAAVWVYYERDKHRYVAVDEYNETGLAAAKHASSWRRTEAKHKMRVKRRIADPKPINVRDRGSNIRLSDQYRRLGYNFELGPNSIDDRVTALGGLIAAPAPRFVCTKECVRLYEQLKNYRWEDLTPTQLAKGREAKPLKKDVDLVDAAQYAVSKYQAPPKLPAPTGPAALHAKVQAQIRRRHFKNATQSHDLGNFAV